MRIAHIFTFLLVCCSQGFCDNANPFLGEWVAIAAESNGRSLPDGILKATQFTFDDEIFSLYGKKLKYEFDSSADPKTFGTREQKGVYRVDGASIKLCVGPSKFPATDFSTEARTDKTCYTIKKGIFEPTKVPWEKIVTLVSNDDKKLESLAYHLLSIQKPNLIGPYIVRGLSDKDKLIRGRMALLARQLELLEAVPALSNALQKDTDFQVRVTCAHALGKIGGGDAVVALKKGLSDGDSRVVAQVRQELAKQGL